MSSRFLLFLLVVLVPILTVAASGRDTAAAPEVTTITRWDTSERVVTLTFDAGADPGYTAEILDTLADEGVAASFGITGVWASQNPDLVRRIAAEGHHLINHSWDHASFTGLSSESAPLTSRQRADQLLRTENVVRELTGVTLKPYFRPPFGDYDASVLDDLAANGYTYNLIWTIDSLGWQGLTASAITDRVLSQMVPGAIILMHVGSQSQDAIALPGLIDQLRARGYHFATAREMLEGVTTEERYFPETGHTVSGNFLAYWERFGGLPVFGYPLTDPVDDNGITVQYFERARFEHHPGAWPERHNILLGLLGNELTETRRTEPPFRPVVAESNANCTFHPPTGHRLCFGFRDYWRQHGGLEIFGYPISEEFRERNPDTGQTYTVQYFERARFEYHPENPESYRILPGRLGASQLAGQGN